MLSSVFCGFVFFKQKTAYEMRIIDWSSDVCSSDLIEVMLVPSCILGPEGCANAGFDQTCVGFAVGAGGAPTAWSGPQGKMASSGGGHSSTKSLAEDQTCRSVRHLAEIPS